MKHSYNRSFNRWVSWKTVLSTLLCAVSMTGCKRQGQAPPMGGVADVSTITVTQQQVMLTYELPGRTSPYLISEIRPQVSGLIQKRLFTEGSDVKAGQELYQIDPAPFQAALDNAKAALGRAEAHLPSIQLRVNRYKEALADKAVSQQDYDDAQAALKQAEADVQFGKATVDSARINLGYTRVVSPISGRIGASVVTDGAIVTAYQPIPLATIQQLDPIYVDVPHSTTEWLRLQRRLEQGQINPGGTNANIVQLILDDGTPYPLDGTLQFRDVSVNPTTSTVTLRMVFPNPKGILLPGMYVRAIIKEGINEKAIMVPQQAVSRDPKGNPMAMVVESGQVAVRRLTLERAIGAQWLVISGLNPGDKLIVEGLQKARPGLPAKEVPFDPAGTQGQPGAPGSQGAKPADGAKPATTSK